MSKEKALAHNQNIKPVICSTLSIKLLFHVIHYTEGGYDLNDGNKINTQKYTCQPNQVTAPII